jgi:lipopolysaccharide export system protein LptC
MRPLLLSATACILLLGAVSAQNTGDSGSAPQLPVGQTFKEFEFPDYENGQLKATLYASQATGITLNRAEASDVKIQIYDNGAVTTTVTSPKADLYVNERIMRTKNTVQIERADMEATSQDCDFDLKDKKYILRTNVKVLLKHFDISSTSANGSAPAPASASTSTNAPDSSADANSAPIPPSSPETK